MEAHGWTLFQQALESYNPKKGANFSTHLYSRLKGIDRYVKTYQNIGYIPEASVGKITTLKSAEQELALQKRRPPTVQELANYLKWPESEVARIKKSLRADIPGSAFEETGMMNMRPQAEMNLLYDFQHELTPEEKIVYDYLVGINGKPKIDRGAKLARKTGFSQTKISMLRTSIANKLKPELGKIRSL